MVNLRLLLAASALVLVGLSSTPVASAQDLPDLPGVQLADLGIVECGASSFDAQGDGHAEQWNQCSTPPCGCNCPYVGGGFVIEAAGQQVGAAVVTSGCQTAFATSNGPADGGSPATVWPIVGGGGLDLTFE